MDQGWLTLPALATHRRARELRPLAWWWHLTAPAEPPASAVFGMREQRDQLLHLRVGRGAGRGPMHGPEVGTDCIDGLRLIRPRIEARKPAAMRQRRFPI